MSSGLSAKRSAAWASNSAEERSSQWASSTQSSIGRSPMLRSKSEHSKENCLCLMRGDGASASGAVPGRPSSPAATSTSSGVAGRPKAWRNLETFARPRASPSSAVRPERDQSRLAAG